MHEDQYILDVTSLNLPSKVTLCGTSYCDGTYKIIRPKSEFGTMEYVLSGTGTIYCNGNKYIASEGDTYFLPPDADQYYYSDDKSPWTKMFFNMTGNLMNTLSKEYSLDGNVIFKGCDTRNIIESIIDIAKNHDYTPYEIQEKSLMLVQKMFMRLYEHTFHTFYQESLPDELRILKDFIDSNITGSITLDDMASSIYRPKNYTIRLFKSRFSITPYEYFLDKKMELSKQLLKSTSLPINQISDYLCFDNPRYFSQSFKKKYGITPTEWRKRQLSKENVTINPAY